MGSWNRVKNWPLLPGTTMDNYGKCEEVWCQGDQCV
jgi:hypothetical protein